MHHKAYKTELAPNNAQRRLCVKGAGTARFAYNWALSRMKEAMEKREKIPSKYDLCKELTVLKQGELKWMYEVSKCCPQGAIWNCADAMKHFFRRCKQGAKKKGFPRFKSRGHGLGSFYLQGSVHITRTHIQLPCMGRLKLKEYGYLPTDKKIISAIVSERAGKWFVSVLVEEEIKPHNGEGTVGVDLGVKTLATCSDGHTVENPRALGSRLKQLRRAHRCVSRKQKGSKNRAKARQRLARCYYKTACIRSHVLHNFTSRLTKTKSRVVIEDLNVMGMMQKRGKGFSRAIADVGFYELRRQLEYKGKWYGCEIVVVDRYFPSSKMCSVCGNIKEDLTLSDRVYECDCCGASLDRDLNAAINLSNTAELAGIHACGDESAGPLGETQSLKQELAQELETCFVPGAHI